MQNGRVPLQFDLSALSASSEMVVLANAAMSSVVYVMPDGICQSLSHQGPGADQQLECYVCSIFSVFCVVCDT